MLEINRKPGERLETMLSHVHVNSYRFHLHSQSFFASEDEEEGLYNT